MHIFTADASPTSGPTARASSHAGAAAQTSSDYTQGVDVSGSTATIWFKPTSSTTTWVDVHYQLDGGAQQNVRMAWNAGTGRDEQVVSPVATGDTLAYSFTYNKGTPAYDTPTFTYTVGGSGGGAVATPTFSPGAGTYSGSVDVSIATATKGATLHYTLDGSTPTKKSPTYSAPIHLTSTTTVKAIGVKKGKTNSAVASAAYTISTGTWNKQTTFKIVNGTNGAYADAQVYWAIVGLDWTTGQFVHVDANGALVPMSLADNGALQKNGQLYTNYFHTVAQAPQVTIPPINSARLYLSVGSPMYIQVNSDVNGHLGYTGPNIENPNDPNIDVTFDFAEMAIVPDSGFFGNTTRVDQFGFPVKLRLQGLGGYDQTVGETETRAALTAAFQSNVPAEFKGLGQAPYSPYRIIAPAHGTFGVGKPNGHYLDAYIASVWQYYTTNTLTFTDQQGTFSGHVVNGAFVFSDGLGTYTIARAPTTQEALLGNGVLNDPTGQTPGTPGWDKQLQIQAQMCAAINRHIVQDPAHWTTPSFFYPAGQASNWYAKFWHDHGLNALAYGFSYDDVGGFSSSLHTPAPTTATVTVGW
ncbi:MAG TPA: beta-1,3-glucanase family protein [Burkholderiaceae bacterium]